MNSNESRDQLATTDTSMNRTVDDSGTPYHAPIKQPATTPTSPGSRLPVIPGYHVERLLGRGGMGKVYLAHDVRLQRAVAIKMLIETQDPQLLLRFRDEARSIAKIQHTNVAQVFETGEAEDSLYLTQEYVSGGSLADVLRRGSITPRRAAEIVAQIADAMHHCHLKQIIHRDLKPSNVLMTEDGIPKVTDFGLAKSLDAASTATLQRNPTLSGQILGTPSYMPPEQATGVVEQLTSSVDIYSIGAILYECLTGRPPFQASDPFLTLCQVLGEEPVSPDRLNPSVPVDLNSICLKCLEKQARKRYASAAELREDLNRFLRGEPTRARPVSWGERCWKWARRNKAQAGLMASVACIMVLISVATVALALFSSKLSESNQQLTSINAQLESKNQELDKKNAKLAQATDEIKEANNDLSLSNKQLQEAREQSDQLVDYALDSLSEYFFEFSDRLRQFPKSDEFRLSILKQAQSRLDQIYELNSKRPRVISYLFEAYYRLAATLANVGLHREAKKNYDRCLDYALKLRQLKPDEPEYIVFEAMAYSGLSGYYTSRGQPSQADEALEKSTQLIRTIPDYQHRFIDQLLLSQSLSGIVTLSDGATAAETLLVTQPIIAHADRLLAHAQQYNHSDLINALEAKLLALRRTMNVSFPNGYAVALFGSLPMVYEFDRVFDLRRTMKKELDRLDQTVKKIPFDPKQPNTRFLQFSIHSAYVSYYTLSEEKQKRDQADHQALSLLESLVADYPNNVSYERTLATYYYSRGYNYYLESQTKAARDSYEKAQRLIEKYCLRFPADPFWTSFAQDLKEQLQLLNHPERKP